MFFRSNLFCTIVNTFTKKLKSIQQILVYVKGMIFIFRKHKLLIYNLK